MEALFDTGNDYDVPLLRLLAELPGGQGETAQVLALFDERYGYRIPEAHRGNYSITGKNIWQNKVRWSRNELREHGFLDPSVRGVWRITAAGTQWLREHPDATHLGAEMPPAREAVSRQPTQPVPQSTGGLSLTVGGRQLSLSLDQVLAAAQRFLAQDLPREAQRYSKWVVMVDGQAMGLKWLFGEVTGLAQTDFTTYAARQAFVRLGLEISQLTRKPKPAKQAVVDKPNDTDEERGWLDAVRVQVTAMRDLLRGRGERPSDERLCDMVQFCYTLGLYHEGYALFALVDKTCANDWHYERTRKLARICDLKRDQGG